MGLVFDVIHVVLWLFLIALFARVVISLLQIFARDFRPTGFVLVLFEAVFSVTDPPLLALRRVTPAKIDHAAAGHGLEQPVERPLSAGLDAKPVRTFPAPRQITIMAAGKDGTLYMGGRDIYAMNMQTGATTVALASQSRNDPLESQRDVLSVWPLGDINNEFVRMYSAAQFKDASQDMATANWVWGFERVDLATGAVETKVFGPLEVVLFSGMARPSDPNQFFGVLTQLQKFDVAAQKKVKSVDLEHSYYCINFATDGSEIYLAGTFNDIAVYDPDTLEKLGNIPLQDGDMSLANSRVFSRVR